MPTRTATLVVLALVACGQSAATPARPRAPRLAAPRPIDPDARGAAYLTAVAVQLQPGWSQFLDDCRLRLPASHPLNVMTLAATVELAIDQAGKVVDLHLTASGNGDFDRAVRDALADAAPFGRPPHELLSDDDAVHLRWLFARDRRQAGPATAEVINVELPLLHVVEGLVARHELARAARRIVRSPDDRERGAATERVMIGALREALEAAGPARRAAAAAIGQARIVELAPVVRALLAETAEAEVRLVAIEAAAALGDRDAVPILARELAGDLEARPQLAHAEVAALVALGARDQVVATLRAALATPQPIALEALALAPVPELAGKLAAWFDRGDARTRAAVCAAIPEVAVIARGLRDADATVRATCALAAGHGGDAALVRRLHELARDRDRLVRARVVSALAAVDRAHPVRLADDDAPEVRVAVAQTSTDEPTLRALAGDRDPDVRAAALAALGDRAHELAERAAGDPAPQVRRAAVAALGDDRLELLAGDDAPEVATAALVRHVAHLGRATAATKLLARLAVAPSGGAERVRIALAWLAAR